MRRIITRVTTVVTTTTWRISWHADAGPPADASAAQEDEEDFTKQAGVEPAHDQEERESDGS